jgi:hypothetical protein
MEKIDELLPSNWGSRLKRQRKLQQKKSPHKFFAGV